MALLYLRVAAVLLVLSVPIARALPAFVAAPEIAEEEDEETVLNREERYAGSGSGYYGTYGDDEDYPVVKPTRVRKPEIRQFQVDASITARYASTLITSILRNPEEYSQEATFSVILPEEAFISKFVMLIDGVEYEAEVKEKEQAQREYDAAKERGQTAGQVKQHDTKPNTFSVSVNVAAFTQVEFRLTYQELLRRRHGVIEYRLSIDPGEIIATLKVDVHITEPQGLQELDAMWLSKEPGSSSINEVSSTSLQDLIRLERLSQNRAHIRFHPTKDQQKMERVAGIVGNLVVQYDVLHDLSAGNLQVMNGYFVHYFSPEGLKPAHKNVVFVIDVSGSMGGYKIEQTKEAMRTILADIREGDRLNIVTFTDYIEVWQEGRMVDRGRTNDTIRGALRFVDTLGALYGTNLHGGLMAGVDLLKAAALTDRQNERDALSMIIMLTDGLPSSGVTNLNEIRDSVLEAIDGQFSLFCLGFGRDLDHDFLDNLATENQGVARKIYTDSDVSLQLKGFYDEVATPLLFNVNITYNHIDAAATTDTNFISYFEGTEIIVAGQLLEELSTPEEGGVKELVATVSANSMDTFIELEVSTDIQTPAVPVLSRHAVDDFCQRLWAYLTIKSLLRSRKVSRSGEEKAELKARALELSMKYHFVTPLTSLLIVRPEEDEVPVPIDGERVGSDEAAISQDIPSQPAHPPQSRPPTRKTSPPSRSGSYNSGARGGGYADSDPHFVVHVPASDVSVCFDILGEAGQVFDLLTDKELGIQVLGFIVAAPVPVPGTDYVRTYFGRIGVRLPGGRTVRLSTRNVVVDGGMMLSWRNAVAVHRGNWSVAVRNNEVFVTNSDGSVDLAFMLHRMNPSKTFKVDHLGFYILNHEGLSRGVHGLIGQFQRRKIHVAPQKPSKDGSAPAEGDMAELRVMDRRVRVVQKARMNSLIGRKQSCWFAEDDAEGLIDGKHTDYLVPLERLP